MKEEILVFGLTESAEKLGKTEGKFVRDDGKEKCEYFWAEDFYNHSTHYAGAIGSLIAGYSDKFTNADGFAELKFLDEYDKSLGWDYPLMHDYHQVIGQEDNPLKTALKEMSREQISDINLLTSKTSANPLAEAFQKIGIEVVKKNKNSEIWFVLDGLDMKKAASKADDKNAHHYSALHHIYKDKNQDSLKGKVLFFEGQQRVCAPWDKNPELWKQRRRTQESEAQNSKPSTSSLESLKKGAISKHDNANTQVPPKNKTTEISHSR